MGTNIRGNKMSDLKKEMLKIKVKGYIEHAKKTPMLASGMNWQKIQTYRVSCNLSSYRV